jgi:hypothetical protein
MAVIFEARIKMDGLNWYIELQDMTDGRLTNCVDLDDFAKKVQEFGDDYGGNIDEVKWFKDDDVPEQAMDEIRVKMAEHRASIEEETGENITPIAVKDEQSKD